MIVAFFGHRNFTGNLEYEGKILSILTNKIGDKPADIYLGGYGAFDAFAYDCCRKYKAKHPNVSLIFITPYMSVSYQRNHLQYQKERYDEIIYPNIEDKPFKWAIFYRNRWIVEKADCIIFWITHTWGGAYSAYEYAKQKNKEIIQIWERDCHGLTPSQ